MARCAIIENGRVVNMAEASEDFAAEQGWIVSEVAQIGYLFDGESFSAPQQAPDPVPEVVTIRQAKLALLAAGLLDDVDAAVAQADRATQIEWEYATEIRRDWPTLVSLQSALGLTDAQVDGLFVQAAAL